MGQSIPDGDHLSKGSEVKLCMQKVRIPGRGALGNKTDKIRSKCKESCTKRVQLGSLGQGSVSCSWLLLVSKEVAPSLVYISLPIYLKGLLEVTVLKRLKCSTETGYHDFTCAHTQTHMHTCIHMHTKTHTHRLKDQKDVASIPASALLPQDLSNANIKCI